MFSLPSRRTVKLVLFGETFNNDSMYNSERFEPRWVNVVV